MSASLSRPAALGLFALVVFCWGFNWPVTKLLVQQVSPLWVVAIRSMVALAVLFALTLAAGSLRLPRRGDWPVVLNVSLLHMTAFAVLMATGLSYVSAGRSVVLGFTTPLWVIPGAMLFLGERVTRRRAAGIVLGLAGLAMLFNPLAFDWSDADALFGNGLLLLAAFCWALSILHQRGRRWVASPYEVLLWQVLVATLLVTVAAFAMEGVPRIRWNAGLVLLFLYGGVFGVALAYWAMAMVNRSLPAMTTSLGTLATPVVGVASAIAVLDEPFSLVLLAALALIIAGIALGNTAAAPSGDAVKAGRGRG